MAMSGGNTKRYLLGLWEYAGELIAAILIYVALRVRYGPESISQFFTNKRSDEAILIGIVFAACIAVGAVFWQLLSSDFGAWLRIKGEAAAYSRAFAFPIILSFITLVVLLIFGAKAEGSHFATILVIYNLLNFLTMIFNLHGFVRLWQDWDLERKR
ncbi:MAG TPA: hypothetical protein VII23_13505 [Terriglobales bacterium]